MVAGPCRESLIHARRRGLRELVVRRCRPSTSYGAKKESQKGGSNEESGFVGNGVCDRAYDGSNQAAQATDARRPKRRSSPKLGASGIDLALHGRELALRLGEGKLELRGPRDDVATDAVRGFDRLGSALGLVLFVRVSPWVHLRSVREKRTARSGVGHMDLARGRPRRRFNLLG